MHNKAMVVNELPTSEFTTSDLIYRAEQRRGKSYQETQVQNVVNVIEELRKLKMNYFLTIANTGDSTLDVEYEKVGEALDTAIEVVSKSSSE